jgi:2-C-methyl-D-erythritol 2,4-cyclodiphosphate synthase
MVFIAEVARLLATAGFAVENVDATVIAQAPHLAPYLDDMRDGIARALGLDSAAVSVKAKSTDGLGAVGRGEGIAAQVVALLRKDH